MLLYGIWNTKMSKYSANDLPSLLRMPYTARKTLGVPAAETVHMRKRILRHRNKQTGHRAHCICGDHACAKKNVVHVKYVVQFDTNALKKEGAPVVEDTPV